MNTEGLTEIGRGMESVAYRAVNGDVLKIYHRSTGERYQTQEEFKRFYSSLNASGVSFALPQILENKKENGKIVTREKYIGGGSFISKMKTWTKAEAQRATACYAEALLDLRRVSYAGAAGDPYGYKRLSGNCETWNQLLSSPLQGDFEKNRGRFEACVPSLKERLPVLRKYLENIQLEKHTLLHGDYCPENVLVREDGSVSGIIDFGFSGVMGDYLFDVATAWRFMDMYGECAYPYQDWFMEAVNRVNPLSERDMRSIYAYILFYSLHSADSFSKTLSDGHAGWCLKNLNNEDYWAHIGG